MGKVVEVVDRDGYTIERREEMSWWAWTLVGIGLVGLLAASRELPAIRRYLRMKSM